MLLFHENASGLIIARGGYSAVSPDRPPRLRHVPTRTMVRLSRAAAVKDGPFLGPPGVLVLDGREHGGRLGCVGITAVA